MRSPREATRPLRPPTVVASFRHALRGLVEVTAGERNMRIHVFAGIAVGVAASEVPLSLAARLALFLCVALVLAAETLNSALESLVDLHTREFRHEARRVKDAAAGAVALLAACALLAAAVIVTGHRDAVAASAPRLLRHAPVDLALLACAALLLSRRLPRRAAVLAAAAGAPLTAALAWWSESVAFAVMSAALFALAAAAVLVRVTGDCP